jgi:hypothetical protein
MLRSSGGFCQCGGLLASWPTVIFSTLTLLHGVGANSVVQVCSYTSMPSLHKEEHLCGKI